jgi:hypothetical protein
LKRISAITYILIIICLQHAARPTWAQSPFEENLDPSRVVWTNLLFQANKMLGTVIADVQLAFISSTEAESMLIASPKGIPVPMASAKVGYITVHRTFNPVFGSKITEEDQVWFNPNEATALGRVRLRRGNDDFKKIYRFTGQGVYRFRREPKNEQEVPLPPEKWTDVKETFYSHNLKQSGCSIVSERSILLYVASAASFSDNQDPISLYVFGKRQLFRVDLSAAGLQALKVKYIAKTRDNEVRKETTVEASKITIKTQPMDSDLNEAETFSFLGLHKNIVIFIDPTSRLPLQISGEVPKLGRVDLQLQKVILQ